MSLCSRRTAASFGRGSFCRLMKVASTSRMRDSDSQRDRSIVIVRVGRIAGPDQADPQSGREGRGDLPTPAPGFARGRQIRCRRRDGIETRSERQRQAGYRAVQIESRQRAAADIGRHCETPVRPDRGDATGPERKNNARPAFGHHRHIAGELNRIAQSFVRMDEDGLACDVFFAEPHRLAKFRIVAEGNFSTATSRPAQPASKLPVSRCSRATFQSVERVIQPERLRCDRRGRKPHRSGEGETAR